MAALVVLVVAPVVVLGVLPAVSTWWDRSHRTTVTCDVVSVEASDTRRAMLVFVTSDCGTLALSDGVFHDGYRQVAAELDARPGGYELVTGEASWALHPLYDALGIHSMIHGYESAG